MSHVLPAAAMIQRSYRCIVVMLIRSPACRALLGLCLGVGSGLPAAFAKDCLVPFTVSIKRADGSIELLANVSPSSFMVGLTVYLTPGDSIVVDLDQNMYCGGIYPRMKVFDACGASDTPGELLHHFPWSVANRHVFRHLGTAYLDIVDIFQYSGTVCLISYESAVGIEDTEAADDFSVHYANGLIRLGGHSGGDLMITDASGRVLFQQQVSGGQETIPAPPGFSGGVRLALLRNASATRVRRFVALE